MGKISEQIISSYIIHTIKPNETYLRIRNFIKEIFFPIFCVECEKEGEWWCGECLKRLKFLDINLCPVCAIQTKQMEVCAQCKAVSYLDGVTALFNYTQAAPAAQLIKQFKYQGAYGICSIWEKTFYLWQKERNYNLFLLGTLIPVPLHPRRERERGFNQAALLAECISKVSSSTPFFDRKSLIKVKYTKQQAKLTREERQQNLRNVFVWKGEGSAPKYVILIDDIYTTGSTMQECAKVLKEQGTEKVWGLVLARD